jgi:hypothetical protein
LGCTRSPLYKSSSTSYSLENCWQWTAHVIHKCWPHIPVIFYCQTKQISP